MAFTIKIGYTTDNPFKYEKSVTWLSGEGGVNIHPLSTINQLSPVFVIDYNAIYLTANYVQATFLGRSYFATISVDNAGKMILTCNVDYISSFDLSNCSITVTRNGGIGQPTEITDNKFPVIPNKVRQSYITVYNSELDENANYTESPSYVLCVISGGVSYGG